MASLSGTVIPMPTPFDERGEVDEKVFGEIIDFELRAVIADYAKRVGRTAYKELYRVRGLQMKMYPRWPAKQLDEKERIELKTRLAEAGWPPAG